MEPVSMAFTPARWQISRPTSPVMRSSEGLPMYFSASWIRDCAKMFKYGDCSSCTASACLRVPSKTESPVVLTNSVSRMESFADSALVRRVKTRPPAIAERRTTAAMPAHNQVCLARGMAVAPEEAMAEEAVAEEMWLALADAGRDCEPEDDAGHISSATA